MNNEVQINEKKIIKSDNSVWNDPQFVIWKY